MRKYPYTIQNESIKYEGKLFEIVSQELTNSEQKIKIIEIARRPPGVRVIVKRDSEILLIKEYRLELKNWDFRLPGGKVFDTIKDYKKADKTQKIFYAGKAAKKELLEEVGIKAKNCIYLFKNTSGASVFWDLYYFEVTEFEFLKRGQDLGFGEAITFEWMHINEVWQKCLQGEFKEDRTVGVLAKYIFNRDIFQAT